MPASAPFQKNPVRSYGFMDISIYWKKYQTDYPAVRVRNNNLDDALRILKKKLDASKIMGTLKNRSKYATTSARKREKRKISMDKARKLQKLTR
jgi:ribosomal protein S21